MKFQVKVMSVEDYGFAVDLANTMDWHVDMTDFGLNQFLEPNGCLVLFDGSIPVGIATCVSFGSVGWFGNFVVTPEYRRQGAGRLLLEYAINYLKSKGVETIGLYGYPYLEKYYSKFGFKTDNTVLTVMHNSNVQLDSLDTFEFASQPDFSVLARFDCDFFGADRSYLLRSILRDRSSLCYASFVNGEMTGYVLSKNCGSISEVGPLVCRSDLPDVALELLKAMLQRLVNRQVFLYLPQNQRAFETFLLSVGFKKNFSLSRMFLGESKIQNGIYLIESLERG
ncbi:MAG: GNAT family N-acetyltransferase [Candidatus Bathyarchaeota archaeon]|nr:GNAT family N-acetyltransferase [Candidatus Termiticorpusculum sp.]